jgi:hypothetical protein
MGGTPIQTEATLSNELERIHAAAHDKNANAREARPASRGNGPSKKRKTQRGGPKAPANAPMTSHVLVEQATEAAKTAAAETVSAEVARFEDRIKAVEDRLQHLYDKQVLQQLGSIRSIANTAAQDLRELVKKLEEDTEVADLATSVSNSLSALEDQIAGFEKGITPPESTALNPQEFGVWFLRAATAQA